jgi:hypothetical protein
LILIAPQGLQEMKSVLRQLKAWRFRERVIRVAWGGARMLAIVGSVLAVACLTDWAIDRYSGSEGWRKFFRWSQSFAPSDPLSAGETPVWFRCMMTIAQLCLAAVLFYYLLVRPWRSTPPVDDLATQAEKAFPAFDHRLVTAIQLNRPTADTRGMSEMLIAEVTREAGEIAQKHNLLSLVDYRRVLWALLALVPAVAIWATFILMDPALAGVLVQRQAMPFTDIEIPRNIHLENATQDVWPTGAEVTVRYRVTGNYREDIVGVLRVIPEGQPAEYYDLTFDRIDEKDPAVAYFTTKLPPASRDFDFMARLGEGRTKTPGHVTFEAPPQLANETDEFKPLTADQVLPLYLGVAPDNTQYLRHEPKNRGDVIDALPQSAVLVEAKFNKPIAKGKGWLIPIERDGLRERELPRIAALRPEEGEEDRKSARFLFNTTPKMIGYRLELVDDRGFTNPTPIRRNIRMWEDRPPIVEFKPESTRHPDPANYYGQGNPKLYEWDMALPMDGVIQVVYDARSEVGIREANIRYRVIPKGVQFDAYPEEYKKIQHPRDDPNLLVYDRLPLTRFKVDSKAPDLGPFDPDLGLFRYSFRSAPLREDKVKVNVQFYPYPSPDPANQPGELEAGGRYNFEVSGLLKKMPDGSKAKIELGDTVELYVEVFDKVAAVDKTGKPILDTNKKLVPDYSRPAGYTREAKRKIVVSDADAAIALRQRDEARQRLQDKLRDLADDQANVFRPKKKPE